MTMKPESTLCAAKGRQTAKVRLLALCDLRGFEPASIAARISACSSFENARVIWASHLHEGRRRLENIGIKPGLRDPILDAYVRDCRPAIAVALAQHKQSDWGA